MEEKTRREKGRKDQQEENKDGRMEGRKTDIKEIIDERKAELMKRKMKGED